MAEASYVFCPRALRLAGLVAVLAGCTDPSFVPTDAAGPARDGPEDAAIPEHDVGPPDTDSSAPDAAGEGVGDAQTRVDAASQDAAAAAGDAGEPTLGSGAAGDAGAPPSWALGLVGTYAKRSINFSYDDDLSPPTNTLNVEHSIVKISQIGEQLSVSVQPCDYTVALKGATGLPVIFKHPDRFPPLTGKIVLGDDNTFTSEQMVSHLGFEPSRGRDCTGGRRAPYEDQTWITTGSCQCLVGVLPDAQSDCRITDTDHDDLSGITMRNPSFLSSTYTDVSIVFDYAVTFAAGELKSGRRVELKETRAQSQACINALNDGCSVGKNQLCPDVGSTKLIRLSEQVTDAGCEAVDKGQFGPVDQWPVPVDCRTK